MRVRFRCRPERWAVEVNHWADRNRSVQKPSPRDRTGGCTRRCCCPSARPVDQKETNRRLSQSLHIGGEFIYLFFCLFQIVIEIRFFYNTFNIEK